MGTVLMTVLRLVAAFYLVQFRFYVRVLAAVRILPLPLAVMLLRRIPRASTVLRTTGRQAVKPHGPAW